MEDREHVMVMCSFGRRLIESSFHLFLEGEHNYTLGLDNPLCYSGVKCVFHVEVSPPVSFICEHRIHFVEKHQSETYIYSPSGHVRILDHHEGGVSSFYICFSSFIAVGLLIMTAAVIVTNIRSKTKATPSLPESAINSPIGTDPDPNPDTPGPLSKHTLTPDSSAKEYICKHSPLFRTITTGTSRQGSPSLGVT
ncbi:hypothetical protein Q8A67_009654 [Cirrhinus molitorella]|uniref:Uncharacterized protein n=1 Tax=Cirrhinus molitorella TaxID=172907 RepID=A0AA88Q2Q1_9TELE|nr:hypothetical protein Q8A67_009654 [Cirrhinus molitorella]